MLNYIAYTIIDGIQNSKKTVLKSAVKNENLNGALVNFIDVETKCSKEIVDQVINLNTQIFVTTLNPKFFSEIVENYKLGKFVPWASK
jgi:hypothetical protein